MAELTVLYDESCELCTRLAERLARSSRVDVAPIGSPLGSVLLRDLTPAERYASVHAVDAVGRRAAGGAALAPISRTFRGGAPLATVLAAFPRTTERAYGLVARHRALVSRIVP